ncbi:MAG: helix-turn-helix transcriptional regulator [Candidatus Marinimicrobia bacterium]|nr:helix-turn-helix transcriptional regulator [Candidatus Neomarinimicrobiota bacterium]
MLKEKKDRLEAKGWRAGSADEFLELSPEESAYLDLKIRLRTLLRESRKSQHLSQIQFAKRIHSSQSRVAKMESGNPSVSLDLIIRSLLALGTTNKDLAKIIAAER